MEVAKVTSKGQITIPISIRRRLDINEGDKVLFIYKPDGVLMVNPNTYQNSTVDSIEAAKTDSIAKNDGQAKEKPTVKAPPKTTTPPSDTGDDIGEIYIEAEVVYEEPAEEAKPAPRAVPTKQPSSGKQVGGLDLSTLLDDIRSIGSNI